MTTAVPNSTDAVRVHMPGGTAASPSLQSCCKLFTIQAIARICVLCLEELQRFLMAAIAEALDEMKSLTVLDFAIHVRVCKNHQILLFLRSPCHSFLQLTVGCRHLILVQACDLRVGIHIVTLDLCSLRKVGT